MKAAESSYLVFTVLVVSMLRGAFANTTARFAGGAAVAAVASPDVSHAYARHPRSVLPGADRKHKVCGHAVICVVLSATNADIQ